MQKALIEQEKVAIMPEITYGEEGRWFCPSQCRLPVQTGKRCGWINKRHPRCSLNCAT
ncbi:hypothetical protein ACLB1T_28355 [Escherichia coli]